MVEKKPTHLMGKKLTKKLICYHKTMKKLSIRNLALIVLVAVAILAIGVFSFQNRPQDPESIVEVSENEGNQENQNDSDQEFVTDIDMNIDHWQTKETEFFTIKFPKEWYWMESEHAENEGHAKVITNNPNFDINRYRYIGIGGGVGQSLSLENHSEVVLTFSGVSVTYEVGTREESIRQEIERAKEFLGSNVSCVYIEAESENNDPEAYCTAVNEKDQKVQAYYTLGKSFTYAFVMWTDIHNEVVKRDILERVAKSLIEKIEL